MTTKDAIRTALTQSQALVTMLLDDLSDAELTERPVPGANTIAWQLGHALQTEIRLQKLLGAVAVDLPAGFAERHTSDASKDDATAYPSKAEYLRLFQTARAVTLTALDAAADADLDKPVEGPIARIAPTIGSLFLLTAVHYAFHTGQFSVVRRKLGKPVKF